MSLISQQFCDLKNTNRKALIPFIMAGDPYPDHGVELMHGLVKAGANLIEVGMPFSDPMADGPVVQAAHQRALNHGVHISDTFDMIAHFRENDADTPVVLMGYLNPVETIGYENFAQRAADAGVDGLLIVDLPPEESDALALCLKKVGIDLIFLIAPTTTSTRLQYLSQHACGFAYYVSLKGVTGAQSLSADDVETHLNELREHLTLPIAVGFGIHDGASAKQVSRSADAIVIGSALIKKLAVTDNPAKMLSVAQDFIHEIRMAIDEDSL